MAAMGATASGALAGAETSRTGCPSLLITDSDNGGEFINHHLLHWCEQRTITFTRSRPGNSNDGALVEQKNWAVVRAVVGYQRYDTPAELLLLNKIWLPQSKMTKLLPAPAETDLQGPRRSQDHQEVRPTDDPAPTADAHPSVSTKDKTIMSEGLVELNPGAIQRHIQALTAELLTLTTSKAAAASKPRVQAAPPRASTYESTTTATRAS